MDTNRISWETFAKILGNLPNSKIGIADAIDMITHDSGKPNIFLCLDEINNVTSNDDKDMAKLVVPISNLLQRESFNFICSSLRLETTVTIESSSKRSVNVSNFEFIF